ncbi:MAG: hypothetical protein HQL67_11605 [Magnetococcales bacterium]|nr:hypothetical protein [Magnetococcales bacterium]
MHSIDSKPIGERIDWLFKLAYDHGATFRSSEAWLARQRYLAEHPTAIVVLKCMDGRINIPVATNTPAGILMPFRNLGGMFDLGWPHLGEVLARHVLSMTDAGRRVLILITYHWSKGDPSRGCAGFQFDTEAAIAHTYEIRRQVELIFGHNHATVYPLVCGFETDEDAVTIQGSNGKTIDLSTFSVDNSSMLEPQLAATLPDMPVQMRSDILPLLLGNIDHISSVRKQASRGERLLGVQHKEWVICLGRGFDFLHTPNLALIIGPYSPDLADPLRKAAAIIESNMKAGRIPDDGFLLLASVPYDEIGVDRARAGLKSHFLASFAEKVLQEEFPALAKKMTKRTAVLDWHSRTLEANFSH